MEEQEERLVEIIEYRGLEIPIYLDDSGQQYYTILDGEEFGFGSFNTDFTSDLKYLIDRKLDLIYEFEEFPGARLEWFNNGYNFRDVRLIYKSRILKVFLVMNASEISENSKAVLIEESKNVLKKYLN